MEDSAYLALADASRRSVLCELLDGQQIELTSVLTDGGNEDDKRRVGLHHRHLPMLADAGYVEWDRESGQVRRGPRFDEVEPLVAFHAARAEAPTSTGERAGDTDE
jgi:hypothetical protein